MNGSKSPGPTTRSGDFANSNDATTSANGHANSSQIASNNGTASPVPSVEGAAKELTAAPAAANGVDNDPESEAETLIDSPVKRREAERRQNAASTAAATARSAKPQKTRIGSLPVPQDDEDEPDSAASPVQSTEISASKDASIADVKEEDVDMLDDDEDAEGSDDDDVLSSLHSTRASQESSRSRAVSEHPARTREDTSPTNSRKRKHRASSVDNLPSSKRRSMEPPARRRLRGMHSEDNGGKMERSPSPKLRGHRRAISTQSALNGGTDGLGRKRKGNHFPVREPKSARGWEESDASSETASRGADEYKRPQRGIGRSTSTPGGRSVGREHKRHVNKYGFTKLAEACEMGDVTVVKEWREKDPDTLELAEFAGNKPLQIAALNGNAEVVAYLISEGAQTDCANLDKDTPLIDASENGHLEVVKLLLDAGVDPSRQNKKGQQALDVVTDETEDAAGIRAALYAAIETWKSTAAQQQLEEEEESRHSRSGGVTSKELHFMARTYDNLLRLVQNNDRTGVQEFLAARVPVDNFVIAAAAKTGDVYLVNMLLAEMTEKKLLQKAEKPMLAVLGGSHFEMVKVLTEMEWFDPLWKNRHGKSWAEIAEEKQGPSWRQEKELFRHLSERAAAGKERRSSSPVSKRETGTRRKLAQQQKALEEDSEDEDGKDAARARAKSKTMTRRLMNRKDLRTAKAATLSGDSEDRSSDEDAPAEPDEIETKPAGTPSSGTRHHLRSKSLSASPELTPKSLRKKRSLSFRNPPGGAMPTLNEEEKDDASSGVEVAVSSTSSAAAEKARREREEEAKVTLELAKQIEERRNKEAAAEAEAKRAQEEAERKAGEDRRLEEERKAEESRQAEEARLAEQARQEEEERLRLAREREELRIKHRGEVLAALPRVLATVLSPEAPPFNFQSKAEMDWLTQFFSPLRILPSKDKQLWVLNLQAAGLLGKQGLELFFGADIPDFEKCLAAQWTTAEVEQADKIEVQHLLSRLPFYVPGEEEYDVDVDELGWEEEVLRSAERHLAFLKARESLASPDCKAKLRRVRLEDVLANLHPLLKDWPMEVAFADPHARAREEVLKQLEIQDTQGFWPRMRVFWEASRRPRSIAAGRDVSSLFGAGLDEVGDSGVQWTKVDVRHEK